MAGRFTQNLLITGENVTVVWGIVGKDKKPGGKQVGKAAAGVDNEDDRPRALQVELSVTLCSLTCDRDMQLAAAAAAAAAAADETDDK